MNIPTSPERVTEALARAQHHWQQTQDVAGSAKPAHFTIAVSREAGTYGAAIAHEVGARLGWPVYDRELLQRIADDLGVRRSLLEAVDERRPGWLEDCLSGFASVSVISELAYFRHLVETLLSLAKIGSCVIVGRGATAALPMATTLRVRIVAPLAHRIAAVASEHGVSLDEAATRVETTDRKRNRFVASHFQIDPAKPEHYDLLVNAARFTAAESADLIIAALTRLREKPVRDTKRA